MIRYREDRINWIDQNDQYDQLITNNHLQVDAFGRFGERMLFCQKLRRRKSCAGTRLVQALPFVFLNINKKISDQNCFINFSSKNYKKDCNIIGLKEETR